MRKIVFIIALAVVLAVIAFGQEETKYTSESVARLSYLDGKAYLQRASDLGYEEVTLNMPVTEGDRLSASEGRVEVYLGRGSYLRLDQNTKVDVLNLPKKGYDRIRLRVWAGNIYLNINGLVKEKSTEVHTSDVSMYVLEKGLYRVDVQENDGTEIMVFTGLVEAAGEEGSNMINAGQRAVVAGGRFTSRPGRFVAAADDSFGQWNESRDLLVRKEIAQAHLPADLEDYEYELGQYGRWADLPPYGAVWTPLNMGAGWRPYYYGRWVWLPLCGWTWMSYDPWGWAPYHYGRWGWDPVMGWYWIPTSIWGPAWV
ncbi:MAG: FecR family protein, partial [Candidatus Aminicenantes bacterium]|nr:FecR family protein [Candidatus Aminicenantes bacterium]